MFLRLFASMERLVTQMHSWLRLVYFRKKKYNKPKSVFENSFPPAARKQFKTRSAGKDGEYK